MSTPHPDPSQQPVPQQPGQQPQQYTQQPYPQQPYGPPQPGQQAPYGAPQGWSPQPQMPPAPEKRKNWFARHKVLTGVGTAVVLVVIIASASGGGGDDDPAVADVDTATAQQAEAATDESEDEPAEDAQTEKDEEPAKDEKAATLPAVGDKVRDGKFEFTVTKLEDGVQEVGDEFLGEEAQGQFVLVHMTVANIGDEAQYFDGSSQSLVDTKGRTHSADSEAGIYLGESNSFLNEINPGNKVDGVVVFDIPRNATPATLELHDSMFSGGVEVAVK
ncbi:DUF4352 domain-containing protein [Isoptericola sp. NPDC056618]|uniref:DUF4352 domain-containing protein n=1 Tax=Isoptericola sp. NPDC056618 TaxID=3345878 RepID=UPI0036CBDFC7